MVYYFTSNVVDPPAYIYMGKDKVENEELIKYGWEEDFHVDNLSSAHVYVRLREGESWENIHPDLLLDCAQLTKANSIEGNKKDNITIIYTPHSNLLKNASMATGQVSFHSPRLVRKIHIPARLNPIVNRLNKTKVEKHPDLQKERDDRRKEVARREKEERRKREKEELRVERERREGKWQREHAYDEVFSEEAMVGQSNQNRGSDDEDDFM